MDRQSLEILRGSLESWAAETLEPIAADLEHYPLSCRFPEGLRESLENLGILQDGADSESEIDLEAKGDILFTIAGSDASVATLILVQILASELLALSGRAALRGWVALPIYDHPLEWLSLNGRTVSSEWRNVPALPIADRVLLPLVLDGAPSLVSVDLREPRPASVEITEPVLTLGFRGCPVADLRLSHFSIEREQVLLEGEDFARKVSILWSQAEVLAMAIRSGILHASYRTALEYAGQRYQGGKIILEHSLVRQMLADFHLADERFQRSWRRIACEAIPGRPLDHGALAEAIESAVEAAACTSVGIQLLGGYGYMEDFGQEKRFRDAKQSEWLLGRSQLKRFSAFEQALGRTSMKEVER